MNFEFYIANPRKYFFFLLLPSIDIQYTNYYKYHDIIISIGLTIFIMDFQFKINKKNK